MQLNENSNGYTSLSKHNTCSGISGYTVASTTHLTFDACPGCTALSAGHPASFPADVRVQGYGSDGTNDPLDMITVNLEQITTFYTSFGRTTASSSNYFGTGHR